MGKALEMSDELSSDADPNEPLQMTWANNNSNQGLFFDNAFGTLHDADGATIAEITEAVIEKENKKSQEEKKRNQERLEKARIERKKQQEKEQLIKDENEAKEKKRRFAAAHERIKNE